MKERTGQYALTLVVYCGVPAFFGAVVVCILAPSLICWGSFSAMFEFVVEAPSS